MRILPLLLLTTLAVNAAQSDLDRLRLRGPFDRAVDTFASAGASTMTIPLDGAPAKLLTIGNEVTITLNVSGLTPPTDRDVLARDIMIFLVNTNNSAITWTTDSGTTLWTTDTNLLSASGLFQFTYLNGTIFARQWSPNANLLAWALIAPSSKQPASANLTNWSAIATTTKQPAAANLTNWAGITADSAGVQATLGQVYQSTNANLTIVASGGAQPPSANLTNWAGITADSSGLQSTLGQVYQGTNANLTIIAAGGAQPPSANLTNWSSITADSAGLQATLTQVYQATNANLTVVASGGAQPPAGNLTNLAAVAALQSFVFTNLMTALTQRITVVNGVVTNVEAIAW